MAYIKNINYPVSYNSQLTIKLFFKPPGQQDARRMPVSQLWLTNKRNVRWTQELIHNNKLTMFVCLFVCLGGKMDGPRAEYVISSLSRSPWTTCQAMHSALTPRGVESVQSGSLKCRRIRIVGQSSRHRRSKCDRPVSQSVCLSVCLQRQTICTRASLSRTTYWTELLILLVPARNQFNN